MIALDAAGLFVGLLVGYGLARELGVDFDGETVRNASWNTLGYALPVVITLFSVAGLYRADAKRARLITIIPYLLIAAVTTVALLAISGVGFNSGATIWASYGFVIVTIWTAREAYDRLSRRWVERNRLESRVLLVGSPEDCSWGASALAETSSRPIRIVGYVSDKETDDWACLGQYGELQATLHRAVIQRCVVLDDELWTDQIADMVRTCHAQGVAAEILPDESEMFLGFAALARGTSGSSRFGR